VNSVQDFIAELAARVPRLVDQATGMAIDVTELVIDLPVESRIGREAQLALSAPRGLMMTGFAPSHGRLRVRFVQEEP
jgi:hypothetical protein